MMIVDSLRAYSFQPHALLTTSRRALRPEDKGFIGCELVPLPRGSEIDR